ncbi:Archaetidylserine synthase [uncultured archaeon]|nr:Archaetidylserine synthase [uncultured archaeon]
MNVLRVMRPADYFTLLNAALGLCAMLLAAQQRGHASLELAVLFVLLAAAADGLDGFFARKLGSSPLGASLDSLADLISFGAAPSLIAVLAFNLSILAWPAAIFYLACAALRLARFNIADRGDNFFEGLPVPAAGIALSASVFLDSSYFTVLLMPILALLMVSSISYPKLRDARVYGLLGLALLAALILFWQKNDLPLAAALLAAIILIYLISPVVISCLRKEK